MKMTTMRQLLSWTLLALFSSPIAAELNPGDNAPSFELLDQHSKLHKLADYQGKWLVLYFYPKDDTPGCTTEACEFRDDVFILKRMGVALLGVSTDDVQSHREFAEKYHLPFSLLSDAEGKVARQYGSLRDFGPVRLAKRNTFIIDPNGRIARIYRNVQPKDHSDQVIADLETLHKLRTQLDSST